MHRPHREEDRSLAAPARAPSAAQPPPEVILGGRRYRLVPIEGPSAAGAAGPQAIASCAANHLTARELQIVTLVAAGLVNKQVAAELQISEWTVSTHLRRIFAKLGVDTRAAMVGRCGALLAVPARMGVPLKK